MKLEICAADIHSVLAAKRAGADRVELCSALEIGGLTPSEGLIRAAVSSGIAVNVLIRPRPGDFLYSEAEIEVMERDVERAAEIGVNGVVIGALRRDGTIDLDVCRRLIAKAGGVEVTFHRAIDRCRDMEEGIEAIIKLGCARVLTSGGRPSALEGAEMIKRMVDRAGERLVVMAGSGVTSENVLEIVERTGVREVHASAKGVVESGMVYRNSQMGEVGGWRESVYEEIMRLRKSGFSEC